MPDRPESVSAVNGSDMIDQQGDNERASARVDEVGRERASSTRRKCPRLAVTRELMPSLPSLSRWIGFQAVDRARHVHPLERQLTSLPSRHLRSGVEDSGHTPPPIHHLPPETEERGISEIGPPGTAPPETGGSHHRENHPTHISLTPPPSSSAVS